MNDYQLIKDFIEFKEQTNAILNELHQRIEQIEQFLRKGDESNDEKPEI